MNSISLNFNKLSSFFVKNRWPWHLAFWLFYLAGRAYAYYVTILYYPSELLILMLAFEPLFIGLVYSTLWLYKRVSKLSLILIGILPWVGFVMLFSSCLIYFLGSQPEFEGARWIDSFMSIIKLHMITFFLLILAKDLMVRLSDLLRYSLYETQHRTVPLTSEIAHLENYISLEKIRLEDDLVFEFNKSSSDYQNLNISPLLLIVLVENAFKHSKNVQTEPIKIQIELNVNAKEELLFLVKNNCIKRNSEIYDKTGIGLENLQRRLEVLYPKPQHELTLEHKDDIFIAKLKINLKSSES